MRDVCRVLYADGLALCVCLNTDNGFRFVLFLENFVVGLFGRLILCSYAFESDFDARYRIDTSLESRDLSCVLSDLTVLGRELLLDLSDLRLDTLIFELERAFLQFSLAAALLCRGCHTFISVLSQALKFFVYAGDLALFCDHGRVLFLVNLQQIVELSIQVGSAFDQFSVRRRTFRISDRTHGVLRLFLPKILDQSHLAIVRTDRIAQPSAFVHE